MFKALRLRAISLIWLICCVFITLQLLGAHAHRQVQPDAQPAHVSFGVLHAEPEQVEHGHDHDGAHLQDAPESVQHQDIELAAISGSSHRLLDLVLAGFCAFTALALWLLAPRTSSLVPIYRPPRSSALAKYAWPPFRGPPAHFVA